MRRPVRLLIAGRQGAANASCGAAGRKVADRRCSGWASEARPVTRTIGPAARQLSQVARCVGMRASSVLMERSRRQRSRAICIRNQSSGPLPHSLPRRRAISGVTACAPRRTQLAYLGRRIQGPSGSGCATILRSVKNRSRWHPGGMWRWHLDLVRAAPLYGSHARVLAGRIGFSLDAGWPPGRLPVMGTMCGRQDLVQP